MRFMLNIYGSHAMWDAMGEAEWKKLGDAHGALITELRETGEWVETNELSIREAKVVRRKDGETIVTDGPFVETREIVGGYYIVDCVDLDRAVELAGKLYEAEFAPIDVRRIGSH
jgi:hypothetical protein